MIITFQTLVFFRESLLQAVDRLLRPYYTHFLSTFVKKGEISDDEETDDHVFSDFDDERGVVFYPPMYLQRYAAVSDCLMDERWCGKLEKVVDLGYHDMSFIKYLKELQGVRCILGVDIESIPLRCSSDLIGCDDYAPKRESPLQITLFEGNAADPDYRLIGTDAVIAIEMIEHMLPHDLDRLLHTVFGFIRPWIAIFTTPNGDFNVLFKALEKNGLRRWDHFFEWSREQFHDWCSNIIVRYPEYTVTCRGIGPGPPGTEHLGCCTQMALFVAKDYHKQQDLNINSLALVATPKPNNMSDILGSWDSLDVPMETNMICPANNESYTELFSDRLSSMTLMLTPSFSFETLSHQDQTSQCNLDIELAKSYLMFDYEQMFNTLAPSRKVDSRVYIIEDVNSRLNCTTLQVNKFSKVTQNLLAKNNIDSLGHTREVVNEIRHLTKMLNFNKDSVQAVNGTNMWSNINWGENAPYWNQYYKVVREYNYPFETKSEECRILDLISDEINRLIDVEYDDEFSVDVNKLEIPIDHLMGVVSHITDDVDKVKDLLEWNGYEVVNDLVIHSRLVVDNTSLGTQEDDWQDNETLSDYDSTDVRSTTVSDGSTIVPDFHARCLRRALDHKVRKLRTMLTADQDVTTELDRVVCRLMKLALRTSRGRQTPPPTRWMQCKLLDLLTLTEKAIERRRKYFIEHYPLKAISFDKKEKSQEMVALEKIKEDVTALQIVNKYRHLVQQSDEKTEESQLKYNLDTELGDDLSVISAEYLKDYHGDMNSPDIFESLLPNTINGEVYVLKGTDRQEIYKLERTQAWLEDDIEIVPYPNHDVTYDNISLDTERNVKTIPEPEKIYKTMPKKHHKPKKSSSDLKCVICKRSHSGIKSRKHNTVKDDKMNRTSKTGLIKKVSKKNSSYSNLVRNYSNKIYASVDCQMDKVNLKKEGVISDQPTTASKPIPSSYAELNPPDMPTDQTLHVLKDRRNDSGVYDDFSSSNACGVAATEGSHFIEIITESTQETIALRRTIGTDAEGDPFLEDETLIRSVSNNLLTEDNFTEKQEITTENVQAQTIFVYDINEPTTSKGIRHVGMDVQCGPDAVAPFAMLSATTSLTRMPKMFTTGIRIGDSLTETSVIKDSSTSTYEYDNDCKTMVPRQKSVGIVIKDSSPELYPNVECSTMTHACSEQGVTSDFCTETDTIKPVPSSTKMEDSSSEFCGSTSSPLNVLKYDNSNRHFGIERKLSGFEKPSLCCGGVQVHSYREKQSSEDILFQGEWQKYRPKVLTKKKAFIPVLIKKTNSSQLFKKKLSKEKPVLRKEYVKKDLRALEPKNPSMVRPKYLPLTRTKNVSQTHNKSGLKNATPVMSGIGSQKRFKEEEPNLNKIEHKTTPVKTDKSLPAKVNIPIPIKVNRLPVKNTINYETPKSSAKVRRPYSNVAKVSSRHTLSYVTSKNLKSSMTKRPSIISNKTITKEESLQKPVRKSYIPLYLRRNEKKLVIKESPKESSISGNPVEAATINNNARATLETASKKSKNELKSDLFMFQAKIANAEYLVLRNEIDNNESASQGHSGRNIPELNKDGLTKRAVSPHSQTSSTCSSPSSVATVRAVKQNVWTRNMNHKKYSASSHTSYTGNSGSENTTPNKNKKYTKRAKSARSTDEHKGLENKENIPQTSRQHPGANRGNEKFTKSPFMGKKKVFIAQFKDNSNLPSTVNKGKPRKSNIDMAINDNSQKISSASSVSQKSSGKSGTSFSQTTDNSDNSNMVLVLEPQKLTDTDICIGGSTAIESPKKASSSVVANHRLITEWIDSSKKSIVSRKSIILSNMRQLVEETLDFIDPYDNHWPVDSETVILSPENSSYIVERNFSPTSFKTVITTDDSFNLQRDLERVLNRTFDSYTSDVSPSSPMKSEAKDLDELSFKSLTSVSKNSDYLLANDMTQSPTKSPVQVESSMRDLYERREQPVLQNPTGALASQVFSGFTINEEAVSGDQPDPINIIDSETGSILVDINRQVTSEELFVSGRSSGSFESCLHEEESVVPNWLFQIISQQQSAIDELRPPAQLVVPLPMPVDEDLFDANGNIVEGVGVGAGAGDGRGIHSDHSQDSSGRGTSITSSNTSSGPQSEAILIDPSALVAQFELMREAHENSVGIQNEITNNETSTRQDMNVRNYSHGESTRTPRPASAMSDADADVSSTDTDVPSDN